MRKLLFTFLLFNSLICLSYGQIISIKTDKEEYKIDEQIEVSFEIDSKADSIVLPLFEDFIIDSGPNKRSSLSTINGETTGTYAWAYKIRPKKSGVVIIQSPLFYIDSLQVKGENRSIHILKSKLSKAEIKEIEFLSFKNNAIKPKGTLRYILNDEFGYIEVFGDLAWEFHRKMTAKEIKRMRKLK